MDEYLEGNCRQLREQDSYDYIGQNIEGPKGKFTISEKSIMAAAHREGVGGLGKFMKIEAAHNYSIKDFGHLSPQEKETMSRVESYKESGETVMNAIHHRLKIFAD